MSTQIIRDARALRAAIGRSSKSFVAAHRQIALRRLRDVLLLAECNPEHAQALLRDARYHAQFILH